MRDYAKIGAKNCQLVTHYGGKKFKYPHSITIGPNEEAVMEDLTNKEVIIFDKDLKLIRTFGQGSGDSKLNEPMGVAVGDNVIVVSDWDDHAVKRFSLQGVYLSKFGSHGSGDGKFTKPQGLCFNSKGLLYVVDRNNCRPQVFGRNNMFLFKFGSRGCNPGEFQVPCHNAIDSSDRVYVTDWCDDGAISIFSEGGHFIKRMKCNSPFAIYIGPDDHMIATVDDYNSITVFSPTHERVAKFGMLGRGNEQFDRINGVAINNSGTIFVVERLNQRLQAIMS